MLRVAAHSRYVACGSRQAFPTHRLGRMLVSQKVTAFEKPVASKNGLETGPGRQQSGVIANPQREPAGPFGA